MALTKEEVKNNLINQILSKFPTADVETGSVIRDIMVDPQSTQIEALSNEIDYVSNLNTFVKNAENISEEDLDEIGANYNVSRNLGNLSNGTITFRATVRPTQNIQIGNSDGSGGIRVKTLTTEDGNTYEFVTTQTVYMTTDAHYNENSQCYEVNAPISASSIGSNYNVGVGTITVLPQGIAGITGCYNYLPTSNGTDKESQTSYALNIQSAILGNSKNIESGIDSLLSSMENVSEVKTLHPNSKEEPTQAGFAVSYVKGSVSETVTETFTYVSSVLEYKLKYTPVISISSVTIDGQPVDFNLAKDTTTQYKDTIYANDRVQIIESIEDLTPGSEIVVSYSYNKLIDNCQEELNDNLNNYLILGTLLVAQANPNIIDIGTNIKLNYSYNNEVTKNLILTGLANYINSLSLGQDLTQEQVFTYLSTTFSEYISSITYPLLTFKHRTESSNSTALYFTYGEYASLDVDSLNINFE